MKIIDVGCGKGRFLTNLLEDVKDSQLYAVDISDKVMGTLSDRIVKENGVLTQIPYADNTFNITYAVESWNMQYFLKTPSKRCYELLKLAGR